MINAYNDNCLIAIQWNANAKLGTTVFKNDEHPTTENGLLLYEMAKWQNLSWIDDP